MQPNAATMPGEALSPTQASTYLSCSAKWWFRYGLGLPDPASGGAVRGRAVHKAIEYYMRAKMAGVILDARDLEHDWDQIWDEQSADAEFAAGEGVESLKESGHALASKYLREAAPEIKPVAVEVPVSGKIAGVPVRGIADILTTDGMVVDVKTASRKPSGLHCCMLRLNMVIPMSIGRDFNVLIKKENSCGKRRHQAPGLGPCLNRAPHRQC